METKKRPFHIRPFPDLGGRSDVEHAQRRDAGRVVQREAVRDACAPVMADDCEARETERVHVA